MKKVKKDAWSLNVPHKLKEQFFEKFRDLCAKYGVYIFDGDVDAPDELKDIQKTLPAIFFEFYDGSTYSWSDGEIEYGNANSFTNCDNENDVITVNGIDYKQYNC